MTVKSMINRRELIATALFYPFARAPEPSDILRLIVVNLGAYHDPPLRHISPPDGDTLYFCDVRELAGYVGVVNYTHGIIRVCGVPAEPGETLAIPDWLTINYIEWPS